MYGQSYNDYHVDDLDEVEEDDYPDWMESRDMERYYEERYEK
jgi:hypothetical protein